MASETLGVLRSDGEQAASSLSPPSARLSALSIEHDDLDLVIAGLLKAGSHDDLLVARLKKRKLQIKDAMACAVAIRSAPIDEANHARKGGSGIELAFLVMLAVAVIYVWPTADDQTLLRSVVLYSLLLNSN